MSFFLMLNIEEDILKNSANQTVDGLPYYFFPYYRSTWVFSEFFTISSYVFNIRKKPLQVWMNVIFGWTIPLMDNTDS